VYGIFIKNAKKLHFVSEEFVLNFIRQKKRRTSSLLTILLREPLTHINAVLTQIVFPEIFLTDCIFGSFYVTKKNVEDTRISALRSVQRRAPHRGTGDPVDNLPAAAPVGTEGLGNTLETVSRGG